MLKDSKTNQIEIPQDQIDYFLEKVVPGLKKLGEVELPQNLTERYQKTPLIAKLYLDRVKNKLLAGLEFQYENIVINPLENREPQKGPITNKRCGKRKSNPPTDGGKFICQYGQWLFFT